MRVICRIFNRSLAGFEAVLLALYSHETTARGGQSVSVNVPDLSHPSVYHESKEPSKSDATGLHLTVISPSLEPYGTVRSTRRARIVGVALELYYSKISQMPIRSKMDFCEFCVIWAGLDGSMYPDDEDHTAEVLHSRQISCWVYLTLRTRIIHLIYRYILQNLLKCYKLINFPKIQ